MQWRRAMGVGMALAVFALGGRQAEAQVPLLGPGGGGGGQTQPPLARYSNPVVPGDYPDPSIIRDGKDYWAVVTSGGWRPPFSVLHSNDLVNWQVAGSVLRHRPPWARSSFWAPEI